MFSRPSKRNQITDVNEWIHFYKEYSYRISSAYIPGLAFYNSVDDAMKARKHDIDAYNYIFASLGINYVINYDNGEPLVSDGRLVLAFSYPAKFAKYFEDKTLITLLK